MKRIHKLYWYYYVLNIVTSISLFLLMIGVTVLCSDHPDCAGSIILLFTFLVVPLYFVLAKYAGDKSFRLQQLLNRLKE